MRRRMIACFGPGCGGAQRVVQPTRRRNCSADPGQGQRGGVTGVLAIVAAVSQPCRRDNNMRRADHPFGPGSCEG